MPNDSLFFSKIISVRLIKSLIQNALSFANPIETKSNLPGFLLKQILGKLTVENLKYTKYHHHKQENDSDAIAPGTQPYNTMVGVMKQMFFGK